MRKVLTLLLAAALCLSASAQQAKRSTGTQTQKRTTTAQPKKTQPAQTKKTQAKKPQPKKTQPTAREAAEAERKKVRDNIAKNRQQKAELERRVKQQMQDVLSLGNEIDMKRLLLDSIKTEIDTLDRRIAVLGAEMALLQKELAERQENYKQSVRYMHRNRKAQSKVMFVFSAQNINQMYRRNRFMNEYATYQKAQGEAVRQKQEQVKAKQRELESARATMSKLLAKGESERLLMEKQQQEQKLLVDKLQKQQKTVQDLIVKEQKQEADLNAKIEKLIAEEIAREKARIEAEKKRLAEEKARKERERKERERQLAAAREREQRAREEARSATNAEEKKAAKQRAREAENERKNMERVVADDTREAKRDAENYANADPDRQLSGSFASNKGRLPMPITGAYQVVRGFGANVVEGVGKGVHLASKGIHLKGQPGAQARCVFDGEVSRIFATANGFIVMVRHGRYISVYCDLASVSVASGQKVTTNQTLGALGSSHTMQFQLRNWTDLLDPRPWLKR